MLKKVCTVLRSRHHKMCIFPFHIHNMQICTVSFRCFSFSLVTTLLLSAYKECEPIKKKNLSWSHLCKWTGENSKHYLLVANTQYECDLIKGNVILWQVRPYFRKCVSLGSSIVFVALRVMFSLEKFYLNKWQYKFWAAHGTIPPGWYNINKLPYLDGWLWFTRTICVHLQWQLDGFL